MTRGEETWAGLTVVRSLSQVKPRSRVVAEGVLRACEEGRLGSERAYLTVLEEGGGSVTLAFTGRRRVPGLEEGARLRVEGTAQVRAGRLVVLNPSYEILAPPSGENLPS